ncbi:hypothetical protein OF83DRAFT_1060957 [Amylostereum chailletii]|nr:hypothetical protein OF83DRAFT_1060957 [Amylostereum chailletii]
MSSTGLPSSLVSASSRLTSIASHITSNSPRLKVVVSRDLGPDVMPLLQERKDLEVVVWHEDRLCDREWLLENVKGAAGLLMMLTEKVRGRILLAGPGLKVVSTMSVGYEHVTLASLHRRDIRLGYTPDVLTDAVADLSVLLALMAGRNGEAAVRLVHDGKWPGTPFSPFLFCGPQLSTTSASPKRTVGFLGFGRIAQTTLARLVSFGVTHCIYTSNPSSNPKTALEESLKRQHKLQDVHRVDLDELARESDVLFVLAPGGDSTYHVVNEAFLRMMKKSSVLVNTARGTLVDSDALAKALKEGWIWGAGLDVVEGEPEIEADHLLVNEPSRCTILPHIGSATFETRVGMATLAAKNLLAALDGDAMPAELDISSRV